MQKNLFIKTYGCQMNVYDSLRMQDLLTPLGYNVTEVLDNNTEIVILNTCHIREKAAEKVYSELGKIRQIKEERLKDGQKTIIIVAGCVGQAEGEEIFSRAPFVDIVVGPQSYHSLPDMISKAMRDEVRHLIELDFVEEEKFDHLPSQVSAQGPSAFVSVQEGCDKFCTYCVVPYTRGAEFSRPLDQVYREILSAVNQGSKEVVLLGQNVNAYHGKDHEGKIWSLADLISHIAEIKGLERIRYTTSHPSDMTEELLKLHGTEAKLMPFLHLPVQAGSNKILKLMNRKHTADEYLDIITRLRSYRPDIVMSSDFIVGFPGETDEDFADTLNLVKKIGYGQCFSFKYSPRPGTPAATREQVPEHIKSDRLRILQEELSRQQFATNESKVGQVLPVLFDHEGKFEGNIVGKSPYMQSVYIENASKNLIGQIKNVKILKAEGISLTGYIEE
ncbi:MAG: tRNA (N6-isopentenyl adenosine(37)-C2)-methylthiotransferase MiaB [Rickettsiaceae bacterium]|nr:tRNA (N6-isopentenyl adenosine(37)-C2)-methylthiotransferase MiaB [Rickettsiaceae bacterium]